MYRDRTEAGRRLVQRLREQIPGLDGDDLVVLGMVPGGVPVARAVALALRAPRGASEVEGGAVPYLRLAGLVGGGWMWLRMAAAASDDAPLHQMKRRLAAFYMDYLLAEHELLVRQALDAALFAEGPDASQWLAGM